MDLIKHPGFIHNKQRIIFQSIVNKIVTEYRIDNPNPDTKSLFSSNVYIKTITLIDVMIFHIFEVILIILINFTITHMKGHRLHITI